MNPDVGDTGSHSNPIAAGSEVKQPAATELPATAVVYNAFISYSHAADGALAPALRDGLQRFATPWRIFHRINPVRSLRIFQDQASLSANPALWPTIENALSSADWFILLASPEAAASPWVGKEVEFWRENRPVERLLIVQTDGDIAWDHDSNNFDWTKTTALPRRLSTVFADEPRWIDARWARTGAHATLRDPRFRDLVAELAAPLRGIAKDDLIGEDIRQHRRLNRWRNAALGVVTMLFIGAVAAAAIAVQQRQVAIEQRQAAIAQRDQAQRNESRAMAALANTETETGSPAAAIRVALAGLPQIIVKPDRAYTLEAEVATLQALRQLRELRRIGQEDSVTSVAFSPDGRTLATGSEGTTARLWDVTTGKEIATLRGAEYFANSVAFSPDGWTLATIRSLDDTIRLWEVATGREIVTLPGASVAFSPDGRTLATGSTRGDDEVRLWDAATGKKLAILRGDWLRSVVFSPDGTKVLTASSDKTARLWNAATGKPLAVLRGHGDMVASAVFSPDGMKVLTASRDKTARLWDAASGQQLSVLRHEDGVSSAVFSPDGTKVLTASWDKTARLWDAAVSKEIAILRHEGSVNAVAFSPDGRTLATASGYDAPTRSGDNAVRLWDAASGQQLSVLRGHEGPVSSVAFSPEGLMLATVSEDNTARLWDTTGAREITLLPHGNRVASAVFSPDGTKVLTASDDMTTRLWDAASGQQLSVLRHEDGVSSAVFSPDGTKVLTASWDETVRLWDAATGKEVATLRGHKSSVSSAVFSPDGRKVLTASSDMPERLWDGTKVPTASDDMTARLWDAASGQQLSVLRHEDGVSSAVFSPDGTKVLTASWDETVRLWDAASGQQLSVLRHEDGVSSAVFSPDGTKVLTASWDETVRLWDAASGQQLAVLRGHEMSPSIIAFSPDGRTVATGSIDDTARLWDAASGQQLAVLRGHEMSPSIIAFSPDGRTVATGSIDDTARLWDAASGQQLAVLRHGGGVTFVAFSPDGGTLATVSTDDRHAVRLWPVGQRLIDRACARVYDLPLSDENKERFGIEDEWCTPKVSAVLRAKLRLDEAESDTKRLEETVEAYRAVLQAKTRERVPLQWAVIQNNLGNALTMLGERESSTKRLQEAVASFSSVLQVNPDDEGAYNRLNFLYHEKLFAFAEAFDLNQAWLERHADNFFAQANFAEAAFTVGRFAEAEQRLTAIIDQWELEPGTVLPLRAIEICILIALDRPDTLRAKLDALDDLLKGDELATDWSFAGSRHFIGEHPELSRHPWLIRLLTAIEEGNAADARVAVDLGQAASAAAVAR